jgi:uncharacterized protein YggE
MRLHTRILPLLALSMLSPALPARAQALSSRVVRATGTASLSVKPDQVKVNVGVVTTGATAQEAAQTNATQVDSVLNALKQILGSSGDIKTVSYSLTPNYRYPQGQAPVLTGYTASNNVDVTSGDLSVIGRIIDAAGQAGANNVQGLRFAIKDEEPVREQVLGMAAKQARAHAQAIAAGLGARVGAVLSAQEGVSTGPLLTDKAASAPATTTPIETGLVTVVATVTVDVELVQ